MRGHSSHFPTSLLFSYLSVLQHPPLSHLRLSSHALDVVFSSSASLSSHSPSHPRARMRAEHAFASHPQASQHTVVPDQTPARPLTAFPATAPQSSATRQRPSSSKPAAATSSRQGPQAASKAGPGCMGPGARVAGGSRRRQAGLSWCCGPSPRAERTANHGRHVSSLLLPAPPSIRLSATARAAGGPPPQGCRGPARRRRLERAGRGQPRRT
mmetsp:Transcript_7158/g.14365  ORF Transcript_7158/g.14365 Transcript_7158/m.14365 type:complete len:213 (+) Transcript_7158:1198-1836(+)